MSNLRRLVLDVLKPHEPDVVELSRKISGLEGVEGVNSSLIEVDEDVKNFKMTIEGEFDFEAVKQAIDNEGGSIHSIDEVATGEKLVEKVRTPQD